MKLFRVVTFGFFLVLCTACTPLMRGVENGKLVSGGQPPLTIASVLPLKDGGRADPFIMTDLGFQTPETWLAVYGAKDASSPMGIAAFSVAPDRMVWNQATFCFIDGPVNGTVQFGGKTFSSAMRIVDAANDPFTPVVGADLANTKGNENAKASDGSEVRWLAQRYTSLVDFRKNKVILEYREPLPEWLADATQLPLLDSRLEEFAARAQAAFQADFAYTGPPIQRSSAIQGLNQRYLGRFLGCLSPLDLIFLDRD